MRVAGIIGGIAPESTIDYYRLIVSGYRAGVSDESYPAIIINSIDLTRMLALVRSGDRDALASYLSSQVARLAAAGADFGLFASNTPHLVFAEVQETSSIPLISIVESTCDAVEQAGMKKVGLLGTKFTMAGGFYAQACARRGIELVVPSDEEQDWVHQKYMSELVSGVFGEATRAAFLEVIGGLRRRHGIEGLILGGTELPLLLRDAHAGVQLFDTTRIHVAEVVRTLLSHSTSR